MGGFIAALTLFLALAGIIAAIRAEDEVIDHAFDEPRRLPSPGSRDLHAITGNTLGRAHVPSWG